MRRHGNGKKGFALGALLGGLCGGMTALLYASSKKGQHLCKDISKKCGKISDRACDLYEDTKEKSEELLHKARSLVSSSKKNRRGRGR